MLAEPAMADRRQYSPPLIDTNTAYYSPPITSHLSSNNPFRNYPAPPVRPSSARLSSARPSSAQSPSDLRFSHASTSRPRSSRNPFLASYENEASQPSQGSLLVDMSAEMRPSPRQPTFGQSAEELFGNLSIDDAPGSGAAPPPYSEVRQQQRHRPTRSDENRVDRRPRGPPRPGPPPRMRRSPDHGPRRPRRNSESSMIDKGSLDPNEERKRRERRKERDARGKDNKSRSGRVRKPGGLDLIDKLDVSNIYGPSFIHHDGPFDACNPHRNRRKDHRAPMEAFPAGSANNALGGAGPVNKNIDLETFHGRGAEGFTDYSATRNDDHFRRRPSLEGRSLAFNPKDKVEIVHGEETVGLGTSTFLDGAPASRAAIQRRDTETDPTTLAAGGLGRKKSIAQRIRGMSQPRRGGYESNTRIRSPDDRWASNVTTPNSPPGGIGKAVSAGGPHQSNERNPFFDDYDEAYDRKGASIKVAEAGQRDAPLSPVRGNGLVRSLTADSTEAMEAARGNSGFLNRVRSLKGKKGRPERPA